ncbi:hypothetical protein Patl1_17772 [Pistacia atlantica]|uniref:Uncharacterized protein n=1 Tax=Pistacia atlantica TaxID=434234 RepID=A0ACC1C1I1_9ROSI|nr:hypothetical protein Patl1_17772 [Pistacia atlantica]
MVLELSVMVYTSRSGTTRLSSKVEIGKFDGTTSFAIWQVRMMAVLTKKGTKKALREKAKKPETMTNAKSEDIDEKALSSIQLALTSDVLREILEVKTTAEAWKKLENKYQTKSLTNRLQLKQRLYTLQMLEGSPLNSHLAEFSSIITNLSKIDVKFEDEDQALLLLCSLPASYKNFRNTMIYDRGELPLEKVKSNLETKEKIDKNLVVTKGSNQSVRLFVDRGRTHESNSNSAKSRSKSRHRNLTCNYCKKKGHIKTDCFKWKNK